MSQALCSWLESWRDTTLQRSILVVGVGPLSTLHSFSAGPVLIAHITLIHVQRVPCDIHAALVTLQFTFRLIVLLGPIATMSAFGVCILGSRATLCSHPGRDATANAKTIRSTPCPLSWSKSHFRYTPLSVWRGRDKPKAIITNPRMMAHCKRREVRFSEARMERLAYGAPM